MNPLNRVIEIIGEGKLDTGDLKGSDKPAIELPTTGVLPILVHKLCGEPATMRVKRRSIASLQKGNLKRKTNFAKTQAYYNESEGVVFVVDTEGDHPVRKRREPEAGRDLKLPDFPMAVGVAHPCIETWLLSDADAIDQEMKLAARPEVPADPESLAAPQKDKNDNPKMVLKRCAGSANPLSSSEADKIAKALNTTLVEAVCPLGFAPFAEEVRQRLAPLFVA